MGVDEGLSASRPKVLRVNSIPVLKTPEDKIRKSSTPQQPLDAAPVPANTPDTTTEDTEPTPSSETPTGSQPETRKTKKGKTRKKKGKKSKKAKADKNECGTRPIPTPQQNIKPPAVSATEADTSAAPLQPTTKHPEATVTQAERELMEHVENLGREAPAAATSAEASAQAPVRAGDLKPAAKKAAAKPPHVRTKVEQGVKTSNSPARGVPEFNESSMNREEQAATQLNNLHRASTASQYAASPAPTVPNGAVPVKGSDHQEECDEHEEGADQSDDEEGSEESDDLEDEIDKEVERNEQNATQPGESQPKSDSTQVTPTATESPKKKKKRREKTPAEKALHARYMKFSRSLKRYLSQVQQVINKIKQN